MTENKALKAAIRERMAETGEPYSVARRAVESGEHGSGRRDSVLDGFEQHSRTRPDLAWDERPGGRRPPWDEQEPHRSAWDERNWTEQYFADGAATEGISVEEFKARHAPQHAVDWEAGTRQRAEEAQHRADETQQRAEQAQERADEDGEHPHRGHLPRPGPGRPRPGSRHPAPPRLWGPNGPRLPRLPSLPPPLDRLPFPGRTVTRQVAVPHPAPPHPPHPPVPPHPHQPFD